MRSAFAVFLRGFVLPFGVTSGLRIEFDGENGRILFYNTANVLVGRAEPDLAGNMTFEVLSADGARAGLFTNSVNVAQLILDPADVGGHIIGEGTISSFVNTGAVNRPYMLIQGPQIDGLGFPIITLLSENDDSSSPEMIAFQADDIGFDPGVGNRSLPRGLVQGGSYRNTTTDDAARAAATNTDMSVTFDAIAGHVYAVTLNTAVVIGALNTLYFVELWDGTAVVGRFFGGIIVGGWYISSTVNYYPQTSGSVTLTVRNGAGSLNTISVQRGLPDVTARTLVAHHIGKIADMI